MTNSSITRKVYPFLSVQVSTGVVVDVGHGVVTCAAVVNGDQRQYVHCDPSEATPTKLTDMVHSVVSKSDDKMKGTLMKNIILTGLFYTIL